MTLQTTKLPPAGGSPRDVATAVNQALDGKITSVASASYGSGAASVTVVDSQVTADSAVLIVPTDAIARDATVTVSAGQFVVTFAATTTGSGALRYVVLG